VNSAAFKSLRNYVQNDAMIIVEDGISFALLQGCDFIKEYSII